MSCQEQYLCFLHLAPIQWSCQVTGLRLIFRSLNVLENNMPFSVFNQALSSYSLILL